MSLHPGAVGHAHPSPAVEESARMMPAVEVSGQERAGRPLQVLHVVESLGSGVTTALEGYIRNTPDHVHTVLAWRREGAHTGDALDQLAAAMLPLPPGGLAQFRAVRRHVAQLRPDVIHAHSSYAGFYVRLLRRPGRSLVYTPHCFSFERCDVSPALRGVFWLTEALLSLRGACVAAVGPREAQLAERLPGRQLVVYVPNVADDLQLSGSAPGQPGETGRLRAAAMGRISPQKDPGFFRSAASLSRRFGLPIEWMWVGGGDPEDEEALREAGVLVTGWSSRSAALGWLSTADVYVHTAAWEGAPMTVLEAATLNLPILARRSAGLEALGLEPLYDTPAAIVAATKALLDERHRAHLRARSQRLLERHGTDAQRRTLEHVYAVAAEAARPAPR
jgi:glycosyltransferase involved in cell wall biosynthesis